MNNKEKASRTFRRVHDFVQSHPSSSVSDIADGLGLSPTTARQYAVMLVQDGYAKVVRDLVPVLGFNGNFKHKWAYRYTLLKDRLYAPNTDRLKEPSAFLMLVIMQYLHRHGPATMVEIENDVQYARFGGFQLALSELIKHGFVFPRQGKFEITEVGDAA